MIPINVLLFPEMTRAQRYVAVSFMAVRKKYEIGK